MSKIVDMTGTNSKQSYWSCSKCGAKLWNDHGWILENGSIICRREDKCFQQSIANKIKQEKEAGTWNPPWRR